MTIKREPATTPSCHCEEVRQATDNEAISHPPRLPHGACPERDSSVASLPQNAKRKLGVRMIESEGARNDVWEGLRRAKN